MLTIRPATINDALILYEWRNDPVTRSMSKTSDPLEMDQHVRWLTERMARQKPELFIAEIYGKPIGTFRIDNREISYTIAPAYRGFGFSTKMLREARALYGQLRAEIYSRNVKSISAARKSGMSVEILD